MPPDKEPNALTADEVLGPRGRRRYAALFRRASPGQLIGEASTAYTMRPDFEGCAGRARSVCGPDCRIVYIVRDPVERLISQHYHELSHGFIPEPDLLKAIQEYPRLVNYSRYGMQLRPWVEAFGRDNVALLSLEAYSASRNESLALLCRFLGVAPVQLPSAEPVANVSSEPVLAGPLEQLRKTQLARRAIVPLLSERHRAVVRRSIGRTRPARPPRPDPDKLNGLRDLLSEDQVELMEYWASGPLAKPNR